MILFWGVLAVVHSLVLFHVTYVLYSFGSGNEFAAGESEGGDLPSFGTNIYTSMILVLTAKCIGETKTFVIGESFKCRAGTGSRTGDPGGFLSYSPITFAGFLISPLLLLVLVYQFYQKMLSIDIGEGHFYMVANHMFISRWYATYFVIFVVSTICILFDVVAQLFVSEFLPSQISIHRERSIEEAKARKFGGGARFCCEGCYCGDE